MFTINKIRADHVIDFAAEELKKYLRMMMPEGGDVDIRYDPAATEGFRLGLLEDFHLPSEAEDPVLDDVIHIDTTETGGILAGSNHRSVLFAVYRFLRENGCRWLYPGIDGDYVPMQDIHGVQYHKMADHRFRGFCNEGSESQTCMLECADYYAKLEMNVYMLEWFIPNGYYNRYYSHMCNEENRIPEDVSDAQILQWKRQCEVEIAKRGLMLHDIGHGWTCRPFGLPSNNSVDNNFEDLVLTEEQISILAMVGGERKLFRKAPLFTNVCMSQEKVRTAMANEVVEYAATHRNIDYLHVWLADAARNHCECDACQKHRPSDWYVLLLNEIDAGLTARGLDTRIVFIAYLDTMFAPTAFQLQNPRRFSLMYAPIYRSYLSSTTEIDNLPPAPDYIRNAWETATNEETLAQLKQWGNAFQGPVLAYEYHFWRHQFLDPGGMEIARRLYEDIRALQVSGIDGYIEDGSQRSGFPNAFPVYIYAATLMDRDCDFEAIKADYFSHIYGPDWRDAVDILQKITDAFDFAYMEGDESENEDISTYYAPGRVSQLESIYSLCDQEEALAKQHLNMPARPQTVSWRLLLRHAEYCRLVCNVVIPMAKGEHKEAALAREAFYGTFGKYELEIERYYDHGLACRVLQHITRKTKGIILD